MYRGALGAILRLSLVAGMAPHGWRPAQRWLKILLVLYGYILIITTSVAATAFAFIKLIYYTESIHAKDVSTLGCSTLLIILILVGGFSAQRRMEHMSRIITQLEQIEDKVSSKTAKKERNSLRIFGLNFMIYIFTSVVLHIYIAFEENYNSDHPLSELNILVNGLKHLMVVALEMQLAACAARVLLTLETINESLQALLIQKTDTDQIEKIHVKRKIAWEDTASHASTQNDTDVPNDTDYYISSSGLNTETLEGNKEVEVEFKIRRLATSYMNISDIVEEWTNANDFLMVAILICYMFYIQRNAFVLICIFINDHKIGTLEILLLCMTISKVCGLVLFIEPFHRCHVQVEYTQLLVQLLQAGSARAAVTSELQLFMRSLMLQSVTYSPLDILTMTRSLVVKIFGCVVTYLVISLTYGSDFSV